MASPTQTTVVAVFRNTSDAQAAEDDLLASGFTEQDIYISSGTSSGTAGTGTTDTHEGGITGWFKRLFGQDDDSERPYYETAVRAGSVLLSVDTTDQNADRAADILNRHSPVNIQEEAATDTSTRDTRTGFAAGTASDTRTDFSAGTPSRSTSAATAGESRAIPVVQEELQVGKRSIARGGVRVYSRVVERPVEESVNLTEERVRVERKPVNRPVTEADLRAGRDEVVEVREFAEEPVVSKQARVVEEVRVNKEATQRTQTVRDTVRNTEVNVENLKEGQTSATSGSTDIDRDFQSDFTRRYGATGGSYDTYAPAYRYGYESASDPRYQGKNFSDVESDLKADYSRRYPNSTWEKMKDSIRYGWDKVTGRATSATSSTR